MANGWKNHRAAAVTATLRKKLAATRKLIAEQEGNLLNLQREHERLEAELAKLVALEAQNESDED